MSEAFTKTNWRTLVRDFQHVLNYRSFPNSGGFDVESPEYLATPKIFEIDGAAGLLQFAKADLEALQVFENSLSGTDFSAVPDYWPQAVVDELREAIYNVDSLSVNLFNRGGGTGPSTTITVSPIIYSTATQAQTRYDQFFNHVSASNAFWVEVDENEDEFEYQEDKFPVVSLTWHLYSVFYRNGVLLHEDLDSGLLSGTTLTGVPATKTWPPVPVLVGPSSNYSADIKLFVSPNSEPNFFDISYFRDRT